MAKYVVSTTVADPAWAGTTILRGGDNLASEIHELTEQPGTEIVLTGSITLASELLRMGVVDELRLFVTPIVAFSAGAVLLRYAIKR